MFADLFNKKDKPVGEGARQYDFANLGKLLSKGFPTESLDGVMKAEKEAFAKIVKAAQPAGDATGMTPGGPDTQPAPQGPWQKRMAAAMGAKTSHTGRPIDAVLPFMAGKYGMQLFESTGVQASDIPTILSAFKASGFTQMETPNEDDQADGYTCYSFKGKDGTHVYMEVDPKGGNIAWVVETPQKEIDPGTPAPVGDVRPAGEEDDQYANGGAVQKRAKKWDRLRPIF